MRGLGALRSSLGAHRDEIRQALVLVGLGVCFRLWTESVEMRLGELERRRMVPLDDVATLGDLDKVHAQVTQLLSKKEGPAPDVGLE